MDHTKRCHHCGHHGHDDESVTAQLVEANAQYSALMTEHGKLLERHKHVGLRAARMRIVMDAAGLAQLAPETKPDDIENAVDVDTDDLKS